ncbi:MAG: FHA domain-containing protein [Verrucomicrobiaceae bacterium]
MSDTDYKKTRIVDRGDLAWGGTPDAGTRIVPENAEPSIPKPSKPEGNKTTILGFSKGSVPTASGAVEQPPHDAMTDPVAAWLVVVQGPGKGTSVQVGYGWSTIGREASNRIVLNFGDASITGEKHARILYDSDDREFKVTHESGINATKVNGKSIDSATILKAGDRIKIGATILRFVPFCGTDFDWSTAEESGTSDEKKA